jgi:uncharacterized DUF497 family protein
MALRFAWDATKNRANVRKHGVAFADAARIFEGPTIERDDDRFDYGERRVYAIGLVNGMALTVVYADLADGTYRLISAWRAEPHERRYFWRHIED